MIKRVVLTLLVWASLMANVAVAKPLGVFVLEDCTKAPEWASFALLMESQDFDAARQCSERMGIKWVLYLTAWWDTPLDGHIPPIRQRAQAAGLLPHIVGIAHLEEWYEHGLNPALRFPIHGPPETIVPLVHWWTSMQFATMKRLWPEALTVWITTVRNDSTQYGSWWYRPLPANVDVVAVEMYVPKGETWETSAGVVFDLAVTQGREHVVLIAQGFRAWDPADIWSVGPPPPIFKRFGEAMKHPRVIAGWMFTTQCFSWMDTLCTRPDWLANYLAELK